MKPYSKTVRTLIMVVVSVLMLFIGFALGAMWGASYIQDSVNEVLK